MPTIKLQIDSVLQIPLDVYPKDFTFNVNGEQFQTAKFFADMLSPKISKLHKNDPTLSEYFITTRSKGNFSNFIDLCNFNSKEINEEEADFISEIIEELSIQSIEIKKASVENTEDNIINLLLLHEKSTIFYKDNYEQEVDFLSENFTTFIDKHRKDLFTLSEKTLEKIINNPKLSIDTEDQLLKFINDLYAENSDYSFLYEYVYFENVESSTIEEFIDKFDANDMTGGVWNSLCRRLAMKADGKSKNEVKNGRYKKKPKPKNLFEFKSNSLKGIFSYLRSHSNINDEVKVTCSSKEGGNDNLLLDIENQSNDFYTSNEEDSWICFEFKNHQIIPFHYSIKSYGNAPGGCHPKSWVIEGKNDRINWKKIDEQTNCSYLNGKHLVHTFPISIQKDDDDEAFNYIRIRQTGPNWENNHHLDICSIEFYGQLI